MASKRRLSARRWPVTIGLVVVLVAVFVAICAVAATAAPSPASAGRAAAAVGESAPGQIVVRYEPGTSRGERVAARREAGVAFGRSVDLPGVEVVETPGAVAASVRRLERRPGVAYAQPNYRYRALAEAPDDTFFGQLWGLSAPPAFGVNALAAWDTTLGSGETIAIVDTGVDLMHPDLAGNLWVNPGEAVDGTDGDGNGKVDDVHGYDFIDDNGDPDDYQFHGTHVAGTAAAIAGNGLGIAGAAPEAEIMAVRVLDGNGFGSSAGVAEGIAYAAEEGAGVVNLSLGGPADSGDQLVEDAIEIAATHGAVVVAAAGNDGADNDSTPTTPCTLPNANLICVAAITESGGLAGFSNFGATTVDIGAPGTGILSAKPSYGGSIFSEDFESGYAAWATLVFNGGIPWGASSGPPGSNHITDSPGENYGQAIDPSKFAVSELFTVDPVDLSGERGCRNHFRTRYQIQDPAANGALRDAFVAGAAAGTEAIDVRFFAGTSDGFSNGTFLRREASISELDNRSDVEPLFAILSDDSIELDGAYVDDIRLICRDDSYVNAITSFANWDQPGSGSYFNLNGTSMATPHVAGVAALVRAAAPEATLGEVVDAILEGVRPVPSLDGKTVTGGIVDADLAIEAVLGEGEEPAPDPDPGPEPEPEPAPEPALAPEPEPTAPAPSPVSEAVFLDSSVGPWAGFVQRPGRVVRTAKRWAWGRFRFRSGEGGVSFVCKIDRRPYRRCGSRLVRRFRLGRHVVRVKARDAAGNLSPRPAVHRFRVVRVRR